MYIYVDSNFLNLLFNWKFVFIISAYLLMFFYRFEEAAWYYIHSKRWNEAHEIIINQLLTKAIINGDYDN